MSKRHFTIQEFSVVNFLPKKIINYSELFEAKIKQNRLDSGEGINVHAYHNYKVSVVKKYDANVDIAKSVKIAVVKFNVKKTL